MSDETHLTWHNSTVTRNQREKLAGHAGCVVWFTGLSGSGKSTIANLVDDRLCKLGIRSYLLDGDNVRHGLNASPESLQAKHGHEFAARFGLGFASQDREENIRRVGAVAELFCDAGVITLVAFVSPYRQDRDAMRSRLAEGDFIEVFVDAPLDVCESRDPKGLYAKARAGQLKGLTGVDAPYEMPLAPELVLRAHENNPAMWAEDVIAYLRSRGRIA